MFSIEFILPVGRRTCGIYEMTLNLSYLPEREFTGILRYMTQPQ